MADASIATPWATTRPPFQVQTNTSEVGVPRSEDVVVVPMKQETRNSIPTFVRRDLVVGRVVGKGAYAFVREIKRVDDSRASTSHDTFVVDDGERRRDSSQEARDDVDATINTSRKEELPWEPVYSNLLPQPNFGYVVKYLKDEKPHKRIQQDLAIEMSTLKSLRNLHPNIINIHAIGNNFFVMDRLVKTLSDKIQHDWSEKSILALSNGIIPGLRFLSIDTTVDLELKLLVERLHVAYDLAAALEFLHDRRIVYRDLKPDNVGFDATGCLKLFDFGFCKTLTSDMESSSDSDAYKLTGRTGTVPYMAPEVDNLLPYNTKCDVYSFSILLWEVLALDFCFSNIYSQEEFHYRVSQGGERPLLPDSWPKTTRSMMQQAWSPSPRDRPTFREVREMLRKDMRGLPSIHRTVAKQQTQQQQRDH